MVHQDNYASRLRRHLELDLLQYRRHIFYMEFDEEHFFGIPGNKWQFNLMKYNIILGGYRYDFGDYYLGAFAYHQCNNLLLTPTYTTSADREKANLYGVGVEFLTKNMRLGMKDRGINFDSPLECEFLGRWGGRFSTTKLYSRIRDEVSWLVKGEARYDILRYRKAVPYVEVSTQVLAGPVTRAVPSVEIGARIHLARFDLTPFFKWSREQESLVLSDESQKSGLVAKNYLYGGARLEMSGCPSSWCSAPGGLGLQFLPEIHGTAEYGLYLNSPFAEGHANMEIDLEALRWKAWTLFLYTDMNFNSRKEDFKPDKISYWLQYGLTYAWQKYFIEGFVQNGERLDSNVFRGTSERFNLAGFRAGTMGMKPGHWDDGISFNGPAFINNWNAQASAGHFFNNRDWQYLWDVDAQVRWDICRWWFVVPYIQAEVHWKSGGGPTPDAVEYSAEPGVRLHGVLDFAIYYRFQHRENSLFFRGPSANENLVGIKAMF